METGWIKIYRKLLEDAVWKLKPEQKVIFLTMLMKANHIENEWIWQGQKLKCMPGQFITSLDSLASAAGPGISIRNVRTAIDNLQNLQILTNESTKTGRLITIYNWDRYQGIDAGGRQSERQSGDKEATTNKNDKNDKNGEIRESEIFISDFTPLNDFEKIAFKFWKLFNKRLEELGIKSCDFKKSKVKSWVNDVRLMIENDKRIDSEINEVYAFIEKDDFWGLNIRSMSKLRKQFEKILAQSRIEQKKKQLPVYEPPPLL